RVPVQNVKAHEPAAAQTCSINDPPPETSTSLGSELPSDSLIRASDMMNDSCILVGTSTSETSPKPTCDEPQSEHTHPEGLKQQGTIIDGF
ncbi:hypothetical protein Dimus_005399, partial [Dionaea muscipula]